MAGPARGGSLTATLRSEPSTFNRLGTGGNQAAVDAVTRLTHASLVRLNRVTGDYEPWLAEKWTASPDGLVFTITLRDGVKFSDGVPLTSADVVFTFTALYDPAVHSPLASGVKVQGKPLQVAATDPRTIVVTLPAPFSPGVALLDNVPIYPRHQLQAALDARRLRRRVGPGHQARHDGGPRTVRARRVHARPGDVVHVAIPTTGRRTPRASPSRISIRSPSSS